MSRKPVFVQLTIYCIVSMYLPYPQEHLLRNFAPQSPPLTIGRTSSMATDKYLEKPNIFCFDLLFLSFSISAVYFRLCIVCWKRKVSRNIKNNLCTRYVATKHNCEEFRFFFLWVDSPLPPPTRYLSLWSFIRSSPNDVRPLFASPAALFCCEVAPSSTAKPTREKFSVEEYWWC